MTDNSIYKFFGFAGWQGVKRDLKAVRKSELYFNSVDGFNDPFEAKPYFEPLIYNAEMKGRYLSSSLLHKKERGVPDEELLIFGREAQAHKDGSGEYGPFETIKSVFNDLIVEVVNPLPEQFGVACFSTDARDLKATVNDYMWFHYGNGLRGLCIEFDKEILIDSIQELHSARTPEHEPYLLGKDVDYVRIRPTFDAFRFIEVYCLKQHQLSRRQWVYDSLFDPIFFTKPLAFSSELEFRIISEASLRKLRKYSLSAVKGVYFGERMCPKLKQTIKAFFESVGVMNLQEVKIDHASYHLNLEPMK